MLSFILYGDKCISTQKRVGDKCISIKEGGVYWRGYKYSIGVRLTFHP